jgi:hypothetical protein
MRWTARTAISTSIAKARTAPSDRPRGAPRSGRAAGADLRQHGAGWDAGDACSFACHGAGPRCSAMPLSSNGAGASLSTIWPRREFSSVRRRRGASPKRRPVLQGCGCRRPAA